MAYLETRESDIYSYNPALVMSIHVYKEDCFQCHHQFPVWWQIYMLCLQKTWCIILKQPAVLCQVCYSFKFTVDV